MKTLENLPTYLNMNSLFSLKPSRLLTILILVILASLLFFLDWFFGWGVTGFFTYSTTVNTATGPVTEIHPGKTLWDVLALLLIPGSLGLITWLVYQAWSQHSARLAADQLVQMGEAATLTRNQERLLAQDQAEEKALQTYCNSISRLILEGGLRNSKPDSDIRRVARAQTLSVLSTLNADRKARVLHFLYEAGLIEMQKSIVDLHGVQMKSITLRQAQLKGANLAGLDLQGSDLAHANLTETNLEGTNLQQVDLAGTDLEGATYDAATVWPAGFNPEAA